ncbi:MAG: hypothetical protein EOP06_05975 [Proteobacteria bacterium]|nr:MAG: hypothetical protein EOP06_05975 [Pseudomonadota bacterium]
MNTFFQKLLITSGAVAAVAWCSFSPNSLVAQSTELGTSGKSLPERVKDLEEFMSYAIPVGKVSAFVADIPPPGWIFANGKTIGNAVSGATERAHEDTRGLYKLL